MIISVWREVARSCAVDAGTVGGLTTPCGRVPRKPARAPKSNPPRNLSGQRTAGTRRLWRAGAATRLADGASSSPSADELGRSSQLHDEGEARESVPPSRSWVPTHTHRQATSGDARDRRRRAPFLIDRHRRAPRFRRALCRTPYRTVRRRAGKDARGRRVWVCGRAGGCRHPRLHPGVRHPQPAHRE